MNSMSLILFAQNKGLPPDAGAGLLAGGGVMIGLVCFAVVINLIMLSLAIWYLITMYKVFSACSERNRDMSPGMIFLVFVPIPLFGYIWQWFIMLRACSSLQKEYADRGMKGDGDFGKTKGLVHLLGVFCAPVGIIGWILYTIQMRKYLAELEGTGGGGGGGKKKKIADDDD